MSLNHFQGSPGQKPLGLDILTMYLRTTKRKNRDGSVVQYYQLAHNKRHPKTGNTRAKVIHSFGRADEVNKDELVRLCRSIARICHPEPHDLLNSGSEYSPLSVKEKGDDRKSSYEKLERKIRKLERETAKNRQTQEKLRESEARLKTIFDTASDLVILTDGAGNFVEVNDKIKDLYGFSREETLGINISDIVTLSPENLKKAEDGLKNVMKSKPKPVSLLMEMELLRKDKTRRFVEAHTKPVIKDDEIKGFVSIIRDITERKQVEAELEKYRDRLEEQVKTRTDELTNVNQQLKLEIVERTQAQALLMEFSGELERKVKERTKNLEEANTALKVLLKKRGEDKIEIEEKMLLNVKKLVLPFFEKLIKSDLTKKQKGYAEIMVFNLNNIISPFVKELSSKYLNLTAAEIRVANIIKQGKSAKEISEILNMAVRTVNTHSYNIRKKLGLNNKKASLATYLAALK